MSHLKTSNIELQRLSAEIFRLSAKTGLYIILDNLRSGNNIGSIFRTADAYRIQKIYITGNSAIPPNKEILKTALGATETVEWEYVKNGLETVQMLKNKGIRVWAIEQVKGSISLENFVMSDDEPLALVFGNEVDGVSQEIIHACDGSIEIPQFGTKHSLNVAVSSGIVIWHIINQMIHRANFLK